MAEAYVIEVDEEAIGLVVRDETARNHLSFHFYSSAKRFQSLEGKSFPSPKSAKRSALAIAEQPNSTTLSHVEERNRLFSNLKWPNL